MLSDSDAATLLQIARETVINLVNGRDVRPQVREEEALNRHSGCFVTIKRQGQLRGCIGNFQSSQPLYREVAEMAVSAASRDPRFPAMTPEELNDFSLEISVLSPLQKIDNVEEIEVGTHGIYLIKGFYRGVLLPQVATEYGWDRATFLQQTSHKAGLPGSAWQDEDSEIYIFSAQIIHE